MRIGGSSWRCVVSMLVVLTAARSAEQPQTSSPFRLAARTGDGWELTYTPHDAAFSTVIIDGMTYLRFSDASGAGTDDQKPGSPQLPSDAMTFGIPFDASLTAEFVQPVYEDIPQQRVAPHPSHIFTDEQEAIEQFAPDPIAYARSEFIPRDAIEIDPPFTLRQQRIVTIRIRPYRYNPATRTLRKLVKATLRVRHTGTDSETLARINADQARDPYYEQTYKSLIWNYEEAKAWRVARESRPLPPIDPTRDWFETGKNYYKARIANDGWHRITRSDILAAGGNLFGVNVSTFKVFAKGIEVPIIVRPDTSIGFYAVHNYGDSSYSDFYTDTSAYWLTWGGTQGSRFAAATVGGTPTSTISSARSTKHAEQNVTYYLGTTEAEAIDNSTVAGEEWYWQRFSVNQQVDFNFLLDTIDTSAPTATVRARVWGIGYVQPPGLPAVHKARFWVNDSLVGDYDFLQRSGGVFTATIPSSWLKAGNNTLRLRAMDTGTSENRFLLDWFEIDYQRKLRAIGDQLVFSLPATGGNVKEIAVGGFGNSLIEIYDVTSKRVMNGGIVSGDSLSGFTITFRDTASSQRTYIAFASGSQRSVPPLKQKMFADIRTNATGADYLIVVHKDFLSQADRLAAYRQSANGVRATVIDVEDIYDEFNYGVMNATKIKTFLRYAYSNWAAPVLSNVLFFGDASWDYHKYLTSTLKTNFVPAYGVPSGDNWFACFDTAQTFVPSLYIGRIPAENPTQAQSAVNKIIAYDNHPISEWNKSFLFINGGVDPVERAGFKYLSNLMNQTYVLPPPIGGASFTIEKQTAGYIDGENKQAIKDQIRSGVSFVSFIGHSGGAVWGVDPGRADEFENTTGKLPFVASVSCNVGGFATPSRSVFSEDLLFADNRGAIAAWASSSLGYASYGAALTYYFLRGAAEDSLREFGQLTTNAGYLLWTENGVGFITIAMLNLNPLIGDPMSKLALPLKPDLAISASDISVNKEYPTPNDTALTLRLDIRNYGLVPTDSVGVSLSGTRNGQTGVILNNKKISPTFHADTLFVNWPAMKQFGLHTLSVQLDPANVIAEVNELNNVAAKDQYVYTSDLFVVKPVVNAVVPAGVQQLVVTSPIGSDSAGFHYVFELDTVDTFASPALISSGPVVPGLVHGEWRTPSLPVDRIYFWRSRIVYPAKLGAWVVSSFSTSNDLPAQIDASATIVRLKESSRKQFQRDQLLQTSATDSGVRITTRPPLNIYCRSLGARPNQTLEYYSLLQVNGQRISGYWWELGSSFMVLRIDDFTGATEFRSFNTRAGGSAIADSMKEFIRTTPVGNYLAISVIFDGETNVNEGLKLAMDSLGATSFRQILYQQSYAFLGRKGNGSPGMIPLEQMTNDSAVVSLTVPNFYSYGSGSVTSASMPVFSHWGSLRWRHQGDPVKTSSSLALLGVKVTGGVDTLRILPRDSVDVTLAGLDSVTSDSRYKAFAVSGLLSTLDANVTPSFTSWWVDGFLPADLAVSAQTVGLSQTDAITPFNLPITVHNIGYATSDSVSVVVFARDRYNNFRTFASAVLDSIPAGGSRSTSVSFATLNLAKRNTIEIVVSPMNDGRDLIAENNTAYYPFNIIQIPVPTRMRIFANGEEIMDGDYVPPQAVYTVQPQGSDAATPAVLHAVMLVDNTPISSVTSTAKATAGAAVSTSSSHEFSATLSEGTHELRFLVSSVNSFGEVDTVQQTIAVNVLNESRLMNVSNFPNPFRVETDFTFVLAGSKLPDALSVRIFTISGRKIREIDVPVSSLRQGFNRVHWDGRDTDGDEVANGYYFYQISMSADEKRVTALEKLVKLR